MADHQPTAALVMRTPDTSGFTRAGCSLQPDDIAIGKLRLFGADFSTLMGFAPPAPRTQLERNGTAFAWLAPNEWLIIGNEAAVGTALAQASNNDRALALDISHGRTAFLLAGSEARAAIASVSPLDTRERAFPVDSVARTMLGETGMFVARLPDRDGTPQFRIVVDQTMAGYATRMLSDPASRSIS